VSAASSEGFDSRDNAVPLFCQAFKNEVRVHRQDYKVTTTFINQALIFNAADTPETPRSCLMSCTSFPDFRLWDAYA
jgi:hypothetical protein